MLYFYLHFLPNCIGVFIVPGYRRYHLKSYSYLGALVASIFIYLFIVSKRFYEKMMYRQSYYFYINIILMNWFISSWNIPCLVGKIDYEEWWYDMLLELYCWIKVLTQRHILHTL